MKQGKCQNSLNINSLRESPSFLLFWLHSLSWNIKLWLLFASGLLCFFAFLFSFNFFDLNAQSFLGKSCFRIENLFLGSNVKSLYCFRLFAVFEWQNFFSDSNIWKMFDKWLTVVLSRMVLSFLMTTPFYNFHWMFIFL